jgi:methionyl-tRNA synthetase
MLSEANKHFTTNKPWVLAKDDAQKARLDTVLFYSLEACRVAGILLQPVMPTKSKMLLDRLGVSSDKRMFEHATLSKEGEHPLGEISDLLFPRL